MEGNKNENHCNAKGWWNSMIPPKEKREYEKQKSELTWLPVQIFLLFALLHISIR